MKKTVALLLALVLCSMPAFAHSFTDVSGHWAEDAIETAFTNKVINGDPDGSFRPDDAVSRAEFVKMLASDICSRLGVAIPDEYGTEEHWASKYYNFSSQNLFRVLDETMAVDGVVPGKMDAESFDMPIARWEMAYILSETFYNVFSLNGEGNAVYTDGLDVAAKYPEIIAFSISSCMEIGLIKGDEEGRFNPADSGTRAEAAVLMNRSGETVQKVVEYYEKLEEETNKQYEEALVTYDKIPTGHPVVTILMSNNKKIKMELYPEYAPQTVANFVALVKDGFYDGLTFHRIVDGFVAQGGDPSGDGTGGSGKLIKGEFSSNGFDKNTLSHTRGVVSMARSQHPDSASSQFFICYDDATFLDGQYAAFGKVVEGMDVVDKFLKEELATDVVGEKTRPVEPIVMKKVTVK